MTGEGAILITGCSYGIGRAAAQHLARRGQIHFREQIEAPS